MRSCTDFGVNTIGGCCGTTPAHISAFAAAVTGKRRSHAQVRKPLQFAASAMTADRPQTGRQPVTIVGERINSQGSRRIKRLVALEENYDDSRCLSRREQVEGGAHVLDICTALTERTDEDEQMAIDRQAARPIGRSAAHDRFDRSEA